ncbi:MAG TPA: hypothetical protein VMR76_00940, partial [Candidatus Saccharimonadia bacterium]|nr:hypothetical protein [Candidatus Saccharimonadia bacterium]
MSAPDFFSLLDEQNEAPDFFSELEEITPKKQSLNLSNSSSKQTSTIPDFFKGIEETVTKQPYPTPYDVKNLSPEQLKKMSVTDRLQYAKDLGTEREYRQSKGLTKGVLSGATFGLSERISSLAPEEGDFLKGFGEFLGSTLPISKLYNVLGKPLVTLASKSPVMAKSLQSLARMTGFG